MTDTDTEKQLAINRYRQAMLETIAMMREHSEAVEAIKNFSPDVKRDLIDSFDISELQVAAILAIEKPLAEIPLEKLETELNALRQAEAELASTS